MLLLLLLFYIGDSATATIRIYCTPFWAYGLKIQKN